MHDSFNIKACFKTALAIVVLLLLALLPLACQKGNSEQTAQAPQTKPAATGRAPTPQPQTPAVSQVRDFILASSYTGEVKSINNVNLTAKVSGRINEIKVDVGDKVKKGDLLVVQEHDIPDIQVKQAEVALALARIKLAQMEEGTRKEQIDIYNQALKIAQSKLDNLLSGATKETIALYKANLNGAQAKLDALLAGPTSEQIQLAQAQISAAVAKVNSTDVETNRTLQTTKITNTDSLNYAFDTRNTQLAKDQTALDITKIQLAALIAPPAPSLVAGAQASVDATKAQLDSLLAPPKSEDVAQLESGVAQAKQQLELIKNPFKETDFEISRIGIQQAQAALDLAKASRDEALLYSPFDGTVSARMTSEGTLASTAIPLLTIISRDTQVSIAIEEAAVGKVKLDQIWDIKVLAYPDRIFKGKVKSISPALNPATRTFDVILTPQDSEGLLLPGMFVTASLPQQ